MNRFPLWKNLLLIAVLVMGCIYALPNIYAPDPAIQITGNSQAAQVDERLLKIASSALEAKGIEHFGEQITENGYALIRLNSLDDQLKAKSIVSDALKQKYNAQTTRYVVALNQASTTPKWLSDLGASPMNLGLDLAGGVHFLLEVDTPQALQDRFEDLNDVFYSQIREKRLFGATVKLEGDTFVFTVQSQEHQEAVVEILKEHAPRFMRRRQDNDNGSFGVTAQMPETLVAEIEDHAVSQNLTTIRNRVNELGVSEPLVQRQGRNRIVVELPGVQDTAEAKKILGKTANLEFRLAANGETSAAQREKFEFYTEEERLARGPVALERRAVVSGEHVVNAVSGYDQDTNGPKIDITLNSEGGKLMGRTTKDNVGRGMAVLFIDYHTVEKTVIENGEKVVKNVSIPDKKIINLATIRGVFGSTFQITGLDSAKEAQDVALLLRAGSLAAPMVFVEERTIGPSLGKENIAQGVLSVQLGLFLVLVFMLAYYKVFGLAANLALAMNLVLLVALMSSLGATLTLPGIAGIVLTVGMAVDANVLIFSRIKEEVKNGLPPQSAINSGFDRAFTTILDANITTLIVAFILFAIGTGPIKGFAVTLSIGILTSMFTAIVGTRAIVNLIYGGRKVSKLWI